MIKQIKLQNFKKFKHDTITLRPHDVSLIVGGNNSGKSTLIHSLAIWEFCKLLLKFEFGDNIFLERELTDRHGLGISAEEFLPIAIPTLNHLWTNLKVQLDNDQRYRGYTLRVSCIWDLDDAPDRELEFGLSLANERLFIRVTNSNLQENNRIPRTVYLPTFTGVVPKENRITSAERRALIGRGMAGSVLRNMVYDLYAKDANLIKEYKGAKKRLSKTDIQSLDENSPFRKLQSVLREVFSTELQVYPFNEEYQTMIRIDERKGKLNENGEFSIFPKTKYSPRDIMAQGSGFLQWLSIFSIILGQEVDLLLLDEPDAHLHAHLQRELFHRLQEFAVNNSTQVIMATHSVEMIKNADINTLYSIDKKKYLNEEISRVSLLSGIGSEYSPRFHFLQKYKRVLFVENESDYKILATIGEKIGIRMPTNIVVWATTDSHNHRVHLFNEIKKTVPELKGVSLRDRDLESVDIVDENLNYKGINNDNDSILLLQWRRKNIESYLLNPRAIACASRDVTTKDVVEYFSRNFALALDVDQLENLGGLLDCDGKKFFTMDDIGIEKKYACNKYDVVQELHENEICEDFRIFLTRTQEQLL